jgi:2,3-bisphosphoglycerate-independent phosphoglycerate mutase
MFEHEEKTGQVKTDPETGRIKAKTSHSLNPVPAFIFDPSGAARLKLAEEKDLGISSLAATCLELLGFIPPADYDKSIVKIGSR